MTNLRLAFRTLFKTPFVTAVAIASLALGIGANAAMYSLFDQILVKPLAVASPRELVNFQHPGPKPGSTTCNNQGSCDEIFSYAMFRDLQRAQSSFTDIVAHRSFGTNLAYRGRTMNGTGMFVSGNYFSTLGLQPAMGRLLTGEDDKTIGQTPVVVLSHTYWRTRFDGNPSLLNDTLIVNGQALTIVGVAPAGFDGTSLGVRPHIFVPITLRSVLEPGFNAWENRRSYWAYLFARLKPGVSLEVAQTAINGPYQAILRDVEAPLQAGMSEQTLQRFKEKQLLLADGRRGQSGLHQGARAPLNLLLGVTAFVLLIACANIANLLLARGAGRAGEMAVRLSIGANRRQLVGQLLGESLLLALLGGAAGVMVAKWTLDLMATLLPPEAAATLDFALNRTAIVFAGVLAIATGLIFGLFPALNSTKPNLVNMLKDQAGQKGASRAAARFRAALATTQIALSMALLVAAGLFIRSLVNVSRVDLGVKIDNVATFAISPRLNGYTPERSLALFERLEDELAALPGVTGVTASTVPLLAGNNWGSSVSVQGFDAGPDTDTHSNWNEVGPDYFKTLGVPLLAGREFTRADALNARRVAIVNEAFANKFNLGRDAVGKMMATSTGNAVKLDIEIIGVVPTVKYSEVRRESIPVFYRPYRQDERLGFMNFYVRSAGDPENILSSVRGVVARLDANLPVEDLKTMPQQVRENVFLDRMLSTMSTTFAVLATLLAAIGLYGVLAYTVTQRTREIGLRMALGADRGRVRAMVLKQVAWMAGIGGVIGLAGAIALGRAAQTLLFEVGGQDPVSITGAAVVLTLIALAAGLIPAQRASRVDPMNALRYE